jgi:hypothetical protein
MKQPTEEQITAAVAILSKFFRDYGGTASDTMKRNAVFSMFSALGGPGQPAIEYRDAIAVATEREVKITPMIQRTERGFKVLTENPLGLSVGREYFDADQFFNNNDDEKEEQEPPITPKQFSEMTKEKIIAACPGFDLSLEMTREQMHDILFALE